MPIRHTLSPQESDKCKTCSFPSLSDQIKNVSLSLFNVMTQALKTGSVVAHEQVVEKRIELCNGCEFLDNNRCSACGCYIALKSGLAAEKCPKGKW